MPSDIHNLFATDNTSHATEQFNIILQNLHLRLEQIVSYGTASAENFWYDQEETEWVLLAKGEAVLEFEEGKLVTLKAGDYLEIPAHEKHRVESCSQDAVWLALHF
jgi:cupin 2 domain-containing protein